uniref:LPD18 domain-containing protein n=1 Tax=Caenorhabditis tropicalis TaxID=1561998 RepID=A0A1I7TTZ9_9PELO
MIFTTCSKNDLKEVLKGCGGELMHPRTTKLKFRRGNGDTYICQNKYENVWIRGGIYIKGSDGRLAVIGSYLNNEGVEEDVSEYEIGEYLEHLNIWNSENEHWYKTSYHVYIT